MNHGVVRQLNKLRKDLTVLNILKNICVLGGGVFFLDEH